MPDVPDLLSEVLDSYADLLGADFEGYANHCRRMLAFCHILQPQLTPQEQERLVIAAAFHDIGIWVDDTLDYLPPSAALAAAYLRVRGLEEWVEEVSLMVTEHHRLRPYRDARFPLVEVFRRADLVDFSRGLYTAGIPREQIEAVRAGHANAGFHAMLARRGLQWLKRHPLRPAPMMKW